jgi:DNA-binding NarL/FixJ family response regulator
VKILIADDHQLVIEAVKSKLAGIAPDTTFVLANSVDELLARATDLFDLFIVDLMMPGAHEYSHVDQILRRHPKVPVIVLSGYGDPALMHSLLDRGVHGFIPKAYTSEVMLSAVRLVLAGGVYVPPAMLTGLGLNTHETPTPKQLEPSAEPAQTPTLQALRNVLTKRQMEVLELLSQGKPNKLIARALNISEGTVKIHLAAIFRALGARNRTEAVIAAQTLTESRSLENTG